MELVICVRHKIDWLQMTDEIFYSQDQNSTVHKIIQNGCRPTETWKRLFLTDFYNFRNNMKALAENQNAKTGCRIIRGEAEIRAELGSEEDCYLVPTDDDDFFRPDISKINQEKGLVLWPETWMLGGDLCRARPAFSAGTNCYAMRKSWLKRNVPENKLWHILRHHGSVSRILANARKDVLLRMATWIDEDLSVSNRHIGTVSFLQQLCRQRNLKRLLRQQKIFSQTEVADHWAADAASANRNFHRLLTTEFPSATSES